MTIKTSNLVATAATKVNVQTTAGGALGSIQVSDVSTSTDNNYIYFSATYLTDDP